MLCAEDCEVVRMKAAKAKIRERVRWVNEDTASCRIRWKTTGERTDCEILQATLSTQPFQSTIPFVCARRRCLVVLCSTNITFPSITKTISRN
jgi:hypothetical protein